MKNKERKNKKPHIFTIMCIVVDICAALCFFAVYGPISDLRDWLIPTAMTTGKHKWIAYTFFSKDYVDKTINSMWVKGGSDSDESAIEFKDYSNVTVFANEYEEQILKKNEGNDLYKIIEIEEENYSGFITVIYDAKRLVYVQAGKPEGDRVENMVAREGAILGINASGFKLDQNSDKIYPKSTMIKDHEVLHDTGKSKAKIIAMTDEGVLKLMTCSAKEAVERGAKWGVEFGPFLIVDGVSTEYSGRWIYGRHPRTAIGQRKDGIVLLMTIDGRGHNGSHGVTVDQLTDIFARYGCINAANLDGGGSSTLIENGKLLNHSSDNGGRYVYDAIILK